MKNKSITILILCLTYSSFACDCLMYPIETYIDKVDIIFTGKVIELMEQVDTNYYFNTPKLREFYKNKSFRAKVLVLKRLKTGELKSDTLEFTSDYTNCDPIYELGESYLFFANKTKNETYKMTHCTYWGTIKDSKKNIKKLKKALSIRKKTKKKL